jgi:hypothetical protein
VTQAPEPASTDSDAAPPGKPRRLGLYLPYAFAGLLILIWSLVWLWLMHETQSRIDEAAAGLRKVGWQVSWSARHVGGYPFRLDVDLADVRLAEPSGWALTTPSLKSEAYAFAPTRWILAAPQGLTFTRPDGGPVTVDASSLRASVSDWDEHPPKIALESVGLAFSTPPGAKPFSLLAAKRLQFDTQSAPRGMGLVYLRLENAAVRPGGWLGRFAAGEPVDLTVEGVVSDARAFGDANDLHGAIANWSHVGGIASIHDVILATPTASFESKAGDVTTSDDGRLVGVVEASLRQPDRLLSALGAKPSSKHGPAPADRSARITFRGGSAFIDAERLGPSPRVF